MRVLVVCESSGTVREAFRELGHDAWSCDLLPADDGSPYHVQGDALLELAGGGYDLVIAHPPCTYLCASGMHWTTRGLRDPQLTEDALAFVVAIMGCGAPRICIENPVGCISTRVRKPDQYIQPYQFGEDASKKTGLWLEGLPDLVPTGMVAPRIVGGKERWANQTDSGQNRLPPSADRWKQRSKTYAGIARAMAQQWGGDTGWRQVSFAADCTGFVYSDNELGDICSICGKIYFDDCQCPGPTEDGFEYKESGGTLWARATG